MSVIATVSIAAVVDASAAPSPGSPSVNLSAPTTSPVPAPAEVELPSATEHAHDPGVTAEHQSSPGSEGGQSVTQVVQLTVIGGDLELLTDHATVILRRVPGSDRDWTGTLPPVRVIDARGTHEGWEVRWTLASVDVQGATRPLHGAARVSVEPGTPVVVAGLADGVVAGNGGPAVPQGRLLFSAASGSGGGTYEAGGAVSLRLPRGIDADRATVALAFALS